MICAEAVKGGTILWKPRENPSLTSPEITAVRVRSSSRKLKIQFCSVILSEAKDLCNLSAVSKPSKDLYLLPKLSRRNQPQPALKKRTPIKMRRRPATRAASYVDFLLSPRPPLARRHDASGPTALPRECHFCPKPAARRDLATTTATAAETGSPVPLVSGIGEEAATPGQPGTRSHALSGLSPGDSPSRITGCCRPCRNHPASSENSHVFAAATLRHNLAPRNRKEALTCAETVEENASLWKPEENREWLQIPAGAPSLSLRSLQRQGGEFELRDHRFRGSPPRSSLCLKKFIAASIRPRAPVGG